MSTSLDTFSGSYSRALRISIYAVAFILTSLFLAGYLAKLNRIRVYLLGLLLYGATTIAFGFIKEIPDK